MLDSAWAAPHTNVVVLRVGCGWEAASGEAGMARQDLNGWPGAKRVFDWTFYTQGTHNDGNSDKVAAADTFIFQALKFFGDPNPELGLPRERAAGWLNWYLREEFTGA